MWHLAGAVILWGLLCSILFVLVAPLFAKCSNTLKRSSASLTDRRLQLLYDTVAGIRVVKA